MNQLSGLDNLFLQAESPRTPMHITPVMIYDPSTVPQGSLQFEDIRAHFEANLGKSAIFRRKLLRAPFGSDKPYWIDDEDFDLDLHVFHAALPKPGGWRELCATVADLHSIKLDQDRPLWEAYVVGGLDNIEGLPPGSFAIILKVHHAAIDGVSGAEIISALHSFRPDEAPETQAYSWQPEKAPGAMEVMWRATVNSTLRPTALTQTLRELIPAVRDANKRSEKKTEIGQRFKTRFNQRVSGHRVGDALRVDFEDIRQIKNSAEDVTINDVVVSIVGGALRRYLAAKNELPEESLVAGAPINTRSKDDSESAGNLISMMRIPLRTDIADPLERLARVHSAALKSKTYAKAIGVRAMTDIADSLSPSWLALGVRAVTAEGLNKRIPTPLHVMVSNVPGPPVDLYLRGARLTDILAFGPLVDQAGLFHGVTSIGGSMAITFTSCRDMLPDPEFYRQCLSDSFEELHRAALS
jgi:WS/DGAT/MGAT family acyltransferase